MRRGVTDALVLDTVSEIENLTTDLSRKIWQKDQPPCATPRAPDPAERVSALGGPTPPRRFLGADRRGATVAGEDGGAGGRESSSRE